MFNLLPKDDKFYDEMEQLSSRVVGAAKQFEDIIAKFPNFDGYRGGLIGAIVWDIITWLKALPTS